VSGASARVIVSVGGSVGLLKRMQHGWQAASAFHTNGEAAERQISGSNFRQWRIRLLHTNFTAAAAAFISVNEREKASCIALISFFMFYGSLCIFCATPLPILVCRCTTLDAIYCYMRRTCKWKSFSIPVRGVI